MNLDAPVDVVLELGTEVTQFYGNDGTDPAKDQSALEDDADGIITMTFEDPSSDVVLTFDGWDIDHGAEVEVFLNGESLGFLTGGVDEGYASYEFLIAAEDMTGGTQTIQFVQQTGATFLWGVKNVLVSAAESNPVLLLDTEDTNDYGNGFGTAVGEGADADGRVAFDFESTGNAMTLTYQGYDIDGPGEVQIILNGEAIGFVGENTGGGENDAFSDHTLELSAGQIQDGTNTLEFVMQFGAQYKRGVTNLTLSENLDATPAIGLTVGEVNATAYGMGWDEAAEDDVDGIVEYSFDATGNDMQLSFDLWDVDWDGEIEVTVNGQSVGTLTAPGANEVDSSYVVNLDAGDLNPTDNVIRFQQTSSPTYKWGVKNVLVEDNPGDESEVIALTDGVQWMDERGQGYNDLTEDDARIDFTFTASGDEHVQLNFEGYDVDWQGEVVVYVNDAVVATLEAGLNNDYAEYDVTLWKGMLVNGENTLSIRQESGPTLIWGVRNVTVTEDEPGTNEDTLVELQLGQVDTAKYGAVFGDADDTDGDADFSFQRTGNDLVLNFEGHDIDGPLEVGVYLNGVFWQNLDAGLNNLNADYTLEIADSLLNDGENIITFKQEFDASYKWGVTNLVLQENVADEAIVLNIGETNTNYYGQGYNGSSDADGMVDMTFTGQETDLTLTFKGYDVDSNTEVSVLLNGQLLQTLTAGVNNGEADYTINIPASSQTLGEDNTLTFQTNIDPIWKWGVSNVRLDPATDVEEPVRLTVGETLLESYGNGFEGNADADGIQAFVFAADGSKDANFTLQGYDVDFEGEVEILLNGERWGDLTVGTDNGFSNHDFTIDAADLDAGDNTISFRMTAGAQWKWGVKDITVTEIEPVPATLIESRTISYGMQGNGFEFQSVALVDEDGRIDYAFDGSANEDVVIRFLGYDIDGAWEVGVAINGTSLDNLTTGVDNGYSYYEIAIDGALLVDGENLITFTQNGEAAFKWGVGNIQVSKAQATETPTDTNYSDQWYLDAMGGFEEVWADYTGAGVKVGVYDDGVEYTHTDLDGNYDATKHATYYNAETDSDVELDPMSEGSEGHGTSVAGLIAAEANGEGIVGTAYGASITGVDIIDGIASAGSEDLSIFEQAVANMYQFDVVNHSWGSTPGFDNLGITMSETTLLYVETYSFSGRGGLGTIQVKSAGNATANANGDLIDASRYTITVAASDSTGDAAYYSNHGANLLVTAPSADDYFAGLGVISTAAGGGVTGTGALDGFGGTSASAPLVSGVVALMLEANPGLGWRDVQEILSMSAEMTDVADGYSYPIGDTPGQEYSWGYNGATDWNGGGRHFSEDFGYGVVNAHDAVRMAEVWSEFGEAKTSTNEQSFVDTADYTGSDATTSLFLDFSEGTQLQTLTVESVEVTLGTSSTDIDVFLISPSGTRVQLFADGDADLAEGQEGTANDGSLTWTFGAQAFRGETTEVYDQELVGFNGIWELEIVNNSGGEITVAAEANVFGSTISDDNVYTYTDEILDMIDIQAGLEYDFVSEAPTTIFDDGAGSDWINMAAMTSNLTVGLDDVDLELAADVSGYISANGVIFAEVYAGSGVENVATGDGDDNIYGSSASNVILAGRGDDNIFGGAGADDIEGGAGDDFFFFQDDFDADSIRDFRAAEGELDMLVFENYGLEFGYADLTIVQSEGNTVITTGTTGDELTLVGYTDALTEDMILFFDNNAVFA